MDKKTEIEFPLSLSLRVMGRNTPEFAPLVFELLAPHVPDLIPEETVIHLSRDERFISLLIPMVLTTRAQFDAVYLELSQNEQVLMVL
jgi:putative lipoic acid-binding regulatory protein